MESPQQPGPASGAAAEAAGVLPWQNDTGGTWAYSIRRRLAVELREFGHAEPKHVDDLVAELVTVLRTVMQKSSRGAWLHLMEALRLAAPFRQLLSGRTELAPYLEGLYYQFHCNQALVSDLDVLGTVKQTFPEDCSVLWAPPRATCPRDPAEPTKILPLNQEPIFAGLPCPFATDWAMPGISGMWEPDSVSIQELQRHVGTVGSEVAREETAGAGSLCLMALTLATEVPTHFSSMEEPTDAAEPCSQPGQEAPRAAPLPKEKVVVEAIPGEEVAPGKEPPMTGLQAAEVFARNRHAGKIKFLYLNVAPNRHFRPYDLVAVPKHLINPQHYVFSPFGVLHVHPKEGSEAFSLGDWHREAVLWQLMQYIPFFRLFLVRKAFACWCFNVKHLQRLKRRENLRLQMLQAVPHFGAALLQISRTSATCPLRVRDDTYKMVHGMQMKVQHYKLYLTKESLYYQRMQYEGLQRRLREAESWLGRLGVLALLVNFLICQTLVSAIQEDSMAFVNHTMKVLGLWSEVPMPFGACISPGCAQDSLSLEVLVFSPALGPLPLQADGTARKAVLRVHLVFSEDSQLVLFPSNQELEDCLLGAVNAVMESVLQTTRIQMEGPETKESPKPTASITEHQAIQPSGEPRKSSKKSLPFCKNHPEYIVQEIVKWSGERMYRTSPLQKWWQEQDLQCGRSSLVRGFVLCSLAALSLCGQSCRTLQPFSIAAESLERLSTAILCGEEPQLVHRLDLKAFGGLEVVGHRLKGEYPLLSREQLEKDLHSDDIIQEAMATQQALLKVALSETQLLCREYSWLGQIYQFVHSWGTSQLESMKGWPAEEYVNRILKLRTWVTQVENVPRMVITYNRLLLVDCSGIHQDICKHQQGIWEVSWVPRVMLLTPVVLKPPSMPRLIVVPLLDSINNDILLLLLNETTQRSEVFIAELAAVLQLYMNVGNDILIIAKCSQKLEQYEGQMKELQEYVDYVRALNEVIQQCFRPLSPSEESLENTLLDTWDAFVYQQREVSDFIVSRRLSIIAELSSSLQKATRELQDVLSMVTVGRFLDPAQNPRAIEEELHALLQHFEATVLRVADLCRSQRILTGDCMDVSFITGKQGVIEIRARIWQLYRIISEQIIEWKCLAFAKFSTAIAMEKTEEWQKEVISLEHSLSDKHPVLQACLRTIGNFQKYLPLLLKLGSPYLKLSCWKEIFAVMGIKCPLNMQFTLGQLLSYPLLEHSDSIFRIYACEKSRHFARDNLHRLQRTWTEKQFRLVNFILSVPYHEPQTERFRRPASGRHRPAKLEYISKDSGTYVLTDTSELKATVQNSILTLQNIILSPFTSDLLEEAGSWATTLRSFDSLLDAWVNFQQKWVFLNIVLYEMDISLPSAELDARFQRVDAFFREFMKVTCNDPLVLSSVRLASGRCRDSRFVGSSLQAAFMEFSGDLLIIIRALDYVLEATRMGFPRLFFLSNEELVALVATASEPAEASAWSQRCFPGVRELQLNMASATQNRTTFSAELPVVEVTGLVGEHGEKLKLCSMVSLSRKATQWLCALEQHMKETLFYRMQECVAQRLILRPQLDLAFERRPGPTELPLHLVAESWGTLGSTFPTQCVLLAEEALWRVAVEEALQKPGCWPGLQLKLCLKMEALAHYVRNYRSVHAWNPREDHLGILLGSLIILTTHQQDVLSQLLECKTSSPQDFQWARQLKYRVALNPERARSARLPPSSPWVGNPPGCWVEVLDSCLPYDYEFLGPSLRLLGSPSLDRTLLGLLLALDEFRCGGLLGHPDVGKSHTVQGLAQALGRQLVVVSCTIHMSISCLARHLCGAVHGGAVLVLDSAEQLETAVLSAFSQRLVDLQRMCLSLQTSRKATPGISPMGTSPTSLGSESSESSDEQPIMAMPELGMDEAEPYQPRVLGNILFGGRLLRVRETYGCVVTLERLPEPLRLAVRPLALLPPNLTRLAEVTLLAAGFREATRLAEKLCTFLRLEGELGPGPPCSRPTLLREVIWMAVNILFTPTPGRTLSVVRSRHSARTTFFLGLDEEPAVVKALCLSPLLNGPECPRLQNVRELLREIFPSTSVQPLEPSMPTRLQSALVAQLHEDKLHPDPQLLSFAGLLFQALQHTTGVVLLGPSGGGKTTVWRTLAKAQSRLAASDATHGGSPGSGTHPGASMDPATLFKPVSTVCLWPNGLSIVELMGSLEGSMWQDGVLSRLLQRVANSALVSGTDMGGIQQWLVLDGAACAEWLEPISSLFSTRPSLTLPNGQRLQIHENVKFLFEMLDASGMPPSVCIHCPLLHCVGASLWRALLSSALVPVYRKYSLTQESLAMLQDLAEELFPPTLAFLQEHCCSVLLPHSHPQSPVVEGAQETMTFVRILHALLEQYMRRDKIKLLPAAQEPTEAKTSPYLSRSGSTSAYRSLDDSVPAHHHLLTQSIFVFAYIWGFGGHLHPRHWPFFDRFVRRALLNSRFSIELPIIDSVFDLCPVAESGHLESFNGAFLSNRVKIIPGSFSVLPQYERVLFVVDLLLGTEQAVLLVGEPGSGKSSFAEMLVQPNFLCHRVCLTPAFSAAHLRQLLHRKTLGTLRDKGHFPIGKPTRGTAAKMCCLFLVEDLQMAFVDPTRGSSPVMETLRQALTHQQFYHAETLELQHCPGTGFNCFGTLSVPTTGARPLCPRLGRLFSTVVLPTVTRESLLHMHTGTILSWLEKFPLLTRHNDLASAIVRATIDTYEAVKSQFQSSPACCIFQFSLHDIQKVIKGMLLLRPRPGIHLTSPLDDHSYRPVATRRTSTLNRMAPGAGYTTVLSIRLIVRLWIHESLRIFCDPLRGEHQRELCGQMLMEIATATFCARRTILRVVPTCSAQVFNLPAQTNIAFRTPSTSDATEEVLNQEELLLSTHVEPGFISSLTYLDPWDPVEQAPPLALDPPVPALWEEPLLEGLPENEAADVVSEELEAGKKKEGALDWTTDSPRAYESHATSRRPSYARLRRRPSSRKENSGPMLPAHLLLLQGESVREIVFSKDLGPDAYSPTAHNPYQEKSWKVLESQLVPTLSSDFFLCTEGLRQVARLSRLLYGPDRHGALVSFSRCTGRQTLVAVVARATASLRMDLPAKTDEAEALALLRLASWQAGIKGGRVLLVVHSGVRLASLHLVMALMAEGTCPGLYSPDDSMSIIQALLQENPTIKRTMRDELILQKYFVRSNLHVLLLLGGPPGTLALPPLTATALAQLLCSLEIYQPWSYASLLEVSSKHFRHHLKHTTRLTREHLFHLQSLVHLAPPEADKSCFLTFRMKLALLKMGEVTKKQQEHTRDVRYLQQKLIKIKEVRCSGQPWAAPGFLLGPSSGNNHDSNIFLQQVAQSQREIEREQEILRQQEKECQMYEAHIDTLTKERDDLEKQRELAMKKVSRAYKAALARLRVQDIEELRSYRQPPDLVVKVTDVLCMMFDQEPGWESAKLLLNQDDFYEELLFYPKENLSTKLFKALGQVVSDKDFSEASIQNASQAAASLYQWISAVYWFNWALREWQPAVLQLQHCDAQINTEKLHLGDRRLHAESLKEATQARIRELKQKQERQEKLLQQLMQSLQAKEEATTVESSVAEHMANWSTLTKVRGRLGFVLSSTRQAPLLEFLEHSLLFSLPQDLERYHSTVYGDALLCAAVLSYLGPFPPTRREELLEKWQALCAGSQVPLGPDDVHRILQKGLPCPGSAPLDPPLVAVQSPLDLVSLLSSYQEQRLWDRVHKPKDPESRLTAMILCSSIHSQAHRWPLLVDPDRQAQVWLLQGCSPLIPLSPEESETRVLSELVPDMVEQGGWGEIPEDKLEILSLTDPDLENNLRNAVSLNLPVLLLNFEKNVPWCPTLQQLMEKESFRGAEGRILPTKSEKGEEEGEGEVLVPPSFQLYLCTELPLEALAAAPPVNPLREKWAAGIYSQTGLMSHNLVPPVRGASTSQGRRLSSGKEELLDLISQPQRSLLEQENFMPMVQLLQTQIQALQATHQHMVSQYQEQADLCDKYRQVARVGTALHWALQQVARLHPLYRFPTMVCVDRVRQVLLLAKHQQDTSKQETLEARLLELSKFFLQQLLTQTLPSLREMDRLLYTFLGALATLPGAGIKAVSSLEWLAFCGGLREPAAKSLLLLGEEGAHGGTPRPSWVSAEAWEECRALEQLPGFQGLLASLAGQVEQWQEYFHLPSTVVGPALCPSHTHLNPFQRAILWRVLCPEAMSRVLADLTTCLLGWSVTEEMVATNPYAYSRANKAIVFLTSPVESAASFTLPLLWIHQMAVHRKRAMEGRALEVNPKFRLWLITAADAPESVPGMFTDPEWDGGLVHRNSTILFCEMPLEFKGILTRAHQWLQGQVHGLDTEQRLPLLVLYALLLYRQIYAPWTQAALYLWSHWEVAEGLQIQEKLSRLADSPPEALQELAGSMLYGGYILDRGDAQAVESLCQQCLKPTARLQPGCGPQKILDLVIGSPGPGVSEEEAAAATQARIAQLPSPMEPTWVGLCGGLLQKMLSGRSQALLSALQASQGLWQPRGPIIRRRQQEQQLALEQVVREGLEAVDEMQGQLERCGWNVGVRWCPPDGHSRPKPRPLQRFLLEEGGTFLAILKQVGRDLRCVEGRLQGVPCSSCRCTAIFEELLWGRMPGPWLPYVPTGPQDPRTWLETLRKRCQLLCHYIGSIGGQPVAHYQLAAFHQPRRLFLALLQERARTEKQDVDAYHLDQKVLPGILPPSEAPEKGLYLSGLEVYHAMWNSRTGQLQETLSAQPSQLPTIWVQASRQPWTKADELPTYQCPVYLGALQTPVPLSSRQVIMHVALPCKMAPELCAQRRVYAISLLQ
ncbi:hypothetical protein JD844_033823 [Phrynosoma platyrhinos]|uniref:Dynein heavy chain domain 1 n=1 Tax=Phrynosoma platyrhinos TaxID=52577 RepID=A0ABQ7T6N1_PHRPL|nr:hypothetical protein JD844_033823 [Phrynosoma platyrhinos]